MSPRNRPGTGPWRRDKERKTPLWQPFNQATRHRLFPAPDQNDTIVNLADFRGRKLFIFFYPKANTGG